MTRINAAFTNINGLQGKTKHLLSYMNEYNIDLFFVVETWIKKGGSNPLNGVFCELNVDYDIIGRGREGLMALINDKWP